MLYAPRYYSGMKQTRAKAGGEVGINGLNYAGGTFLPNTTLAKMARTGGAGTRKQCVAPYAWEVPPAAGMVAVFGIIRELIDKNGSINAQACAYYGRTPDQARRMQAAWQNGIRWMAAV